MMRCSVLSFVGILTLWAVVLVLGVAAFIVHQNPSGLTRNITAYLSAQLDGTSIVAESVSLRLFPLPALQVKGLVLRTAPGQATSGNPTASVSVFVDSCEAYPAFGSLLHGELQLSSVRLVRPSVLVELSTVGAIPTQPAPPKRSATPPQSSAPALPVQVQQTAHQKTNPPDASLISLLNGLVIDVEDGMVSIRQTHTENRTPKSSTPTRETARQVVKLTGLSGSLRLPDTVPFDPSQPGLSTAAPGRLQLAVAHLEGPREPVHTDGSETPNPAFLIRAIQLELDAVQLRLPASVLDACQSATPPWAKLFDELAVQASVDLSMDVPGDTSAKQSDPARFQCVFSLNKNIGQTLSLQGKTEIRGALPIQGYATPVRLTVPFSTTPPEPSNTAAPSQSDPFAMPPLYISGASLHLDKDKAYFDGRLLFAEPAKSSGTIAKENSGKDAVKNTGKTKPAPRNSLPLLEGVLKVQHLSLPRWFGFARKTPPGVQIALDDLAGELAFTLSPAALDVYSLKGTVLGLPVTGRGGVANFAKPVIALDARTEQASLNAVFPELLGKTPKAPVFPMPPALELDDSPPTPGDVGYDIRLYAEKTSLWKWDGRGLAFRVSPVPYGQANQTGQAGSPQLDASLKSFYGGTLKARLVVEDDLLMTLDVAGMETETPFAKFVQSTTPRTGGKLTGSARLKGQGDTLIQFLAGLRGSVDIRMENGFLTTTRQGKANRTPFRLLRAQFQGEGRKLSRTERPTSVPYAGQWVAELETPEYRGSARLSGPIRFSTTNWLPVRADSIPARLSGTGSGFGVNADGNLSFDLTAWTLDYAGLQGQFFSTGNRPVSASSTKNNLHTGYGGHTLSGTLRISHLDSAPIVEGPLQLSSTGLRSFLSERGFSAVDTLPSGVLQDLRVSGDLFYSEQECRLSDLRGQFDKTTFSGSVSRQSGTLPNWKADLQLEKLDMDQYLPKSDSTTRKTSSPWPVEQLNTFELQGQLRIQELSIAKMPHKHVAIPLTLKRGLFTAEPITADVCGGTVRAGFRTEATSGGALTRLRYMLTNTDVLALTQARKQDTLLSGRGALSTDIRALLHSSADIPAAFNGTWGFRIHDGSLDPLSPATRSNSRSRFSSLGASGTVHSGVLTSTDLMLAGTGFTVRGQGAINLVNWTLDYNLIATGSGIPDIPISYHGSLDDPKRSINALGVIGSTIGNIGSGILGILDDVISAPMKIIGPPKRPRR